jgi:cytochrome c peroxidase
MRRLLLLLITVLPVRAADLTLRVQPRWGDAGLALSETEVTNHAGQLLRLTRFSALISEVTLERADGGVVQLNGQCGFLDAATDRLVVALKNVPAGDYAGLSFQIGLPAEVNHADPAKWPAGHPLNPLTNGLHWSWAGGYVFAALEGYYRADAGERGFSYHLATDARPMAVGFSSAFQVGPNVTIDLAVDLRRVLGDHEISASDGSESTHSGINDSLAPEIARAFERSWFFLGARQSVSERATAVTGSPAAKPSAPSSATPRAFVVPAGFPQPALPSDNPLTDEGVRLGEVLFNDRRLSAGTAQSCADCHQAERAFSDGRAVSPGADGTLGTRNAPALFNLAWSPNYGWDGAKTRLRDQVTAAMLNPIEMHADPAVVVATLGKDAEFRRAFAGVFGSPEISVERIGLAIEQYLLTLVTADSKFDRAMRGSATLTEEELQGLALFATEFDPVRGRRGADCFHCHGGMLFTDFGIRSNGLGDSSADRGLAQVTGKTTDGGKFKTPSLRNVALSGPYMHDGRFATLEEVVAHYDHGVRRTAALDPNLAKHPDAGLALTAAEQRALIAFLRTLTDTPATPGS